MVHSSWKVSQVVNYQPPWWNTILSSLSNLSVVTDDLNQVKSLRSNEFFENPVAEFKEFERRFKFKPEFKYGWFQMVSNVSRFKPALNLNRVLADLNRGSNSLNSISGGAYTPTNFPQGGGMDCHLWNLVWKPQ